MLAECLQEQITEPAGASKGVAGLCDAGLDFLTR